ncbi:hypothetical protein [Candidatus Thiodictyon syntrophicum]|jgi:hypothetical protein|nr:hypothetical protein [Candidatus Thiodictyon syntrophicum]
MLQQPDHLSIQRPTVRRIALAQARGQWHRHVVEQQWRHGLSSIDSVTT